MIDSVYNSCKIYFQKFENDDEASFKSFPVVFWNLNYFSVLFFSHLKYESILFVIFGIHSSGLPSIRKQPNAPQLFKKCF